MISKDRLIPGLLAAVAVALVFNPVVASAAPSCESLASLKLADTTITAVTSVPAGSFTPPAAPGAPNAPAPIQVPAFCRVQLTIAPSIKVEVWLPASGWNGDFEGVGTGGYAGNVGYGGLATALRAGYAAASTDTGHEGGDPKFALGHPELVVDYGYRAVHEMTLKSQQIVSAFYGNASKDSYFSGCSNGGRQGLTEAQRYPQDYNGILVGAPAIDWSHMAVSGLTKGLATLKDEGSYIPATKLAAVQEASVAACDAQDGLKDGLINDPRMCKFDPAVLLCKGEDSDSCLTAKQVDAMKKLYQGASSLDGKAIYPPFFPGVEKGWSNFTTGAAPGKSGLFTLGDGYMKYFVLQDPNWDFRTWDTAKDMALVDKAKARDIVDSNDPNLKAFRDHGGKMIIYQGWGDDVVSPIRTINYYRSVVAKLTGVGKGNDAYSPLTADFERASDQTGNAVRLFMVPGMNHCQGGTGPSTFDGLAVLNGWVENKKAPDKIIASHMTNNAVDRTRPLCPYPMTAQYTGQGSIDDAANFVCKPPNGKLVSGLTQRN